MPKLAATEISSLQKEIESNLYRKLNKLLDKVDRYTRNLVNQRLGNLDAYNKLPQLIEMTNKIEKVLKVTDTRMIELDYISINIAASIIPTIIDSYVKNNIELTPKKLVELFYANDNSEVGAPLINLPASLSAPKSTSIIIQQKWWKNNLTRTIQQNQESIRRSLGLLDFNMPYSSDYVIEKTKKDQADREKYLKSVVVTKKDNDNVVSLFDIAKTKRQEFAEVCAILNGMDKYAIEAGMDSALITITAPSEFHASSTNFNNATPTETHKTLIKQWNKCIQAIKKRKKTHFAFRMSEVHIDSTPHLHILVHFENGFKIDFQKILMRVFNTETLDSGILHWGDLDRSITNGISYVIKTLAESELSERVTSSRKLWKIKSYGYSGLPKNCVNAWRETRKIRLNSTNNTKAHDLLEEVKNNNFKTFYIAYKNGDILYNKEKDIPCELVIFKEKFCGKKSNKENTKAGFSKNSEIIGVENYPSKVDDKIKPGIKEAFFQFKINLRSLCKTISSKANCLMSFFKKSRMCKNLKLILQPNKKLRVLRLRHFTDSS